MKLVYRLKHAQDKLARLKNHLTFLIRCRENKITPSGLRVTLPLRSPSVHKIARCTELALLRQLIRDIHYKKAMIEKEIDTFGGEIRTLVDDNKWRQLETWCKSTTEMISLDTKARQMQKFEHLQAKQHPGPQLNKEKLVKNLSNRSLTEKEKDVLALGLNFAVAPKGSQPLKSLQLRSQQPASLTERQLNNSDTG